MARPGNLAHRIERLLNEHLFRSAFAEGRRRAVVSLLLIPVALFAATALIRVPNARRKRRHLHHRALLHRLGSSTRRSVGPARRLRRRKTPLNSLPHPSRSTESGGCTPAQGPATAPPAGVVLRPVLATAMP